MALVDMSYPSSMVWTLLSTSDDMLATHADQFPHAMWRSSLAVFAFDPDPADYPEDAEEFKNRQLTFLKVVASITSYTPPCDGCPPQPKRKIFLEDYGDYQAEDDAWKKADELCHQLLHQSYPCAGALVQVAVYPKEGDTTDVNQLAYFAAFEPKKRELIEVATESGESVTQSKSDLNVKKGLTSTQSTEDLDVFTGANLSVGAGGASVGVGFSGQWGTIKKSGTQQEDITNTDSSRELREGASHTATLSQLYHLLSSYHLGTNRAIFFLQPRPHTLQQKDQFTFINGPQEIEGIQEFFLVVSRPKDKNIEDYCVDALLYTGHLDIIAMRDAINEPKTAETPWIDLWTSLPPLPHDDRPWWDPGKLLGEAVKVAQDTLNSLGEMMGVTTAGELPEGVTIRQPAILDVYIPPVVLNNPNDPNAATIYKTLPAVAAGDNGWRIDRTRGLGGYDLWEDPNNRSADFRGKFDENKTPKAQAYVDIVPCGTPDDLQHYIPDYALHVRAMAYPWASDDGQATYHCRVKAYFIRNDLPTQQRNVKMFVTARGVSNCAESPFADLEPNNAVVILAGQSAELVADAVLHPPNIAPWTPPSSRDSAVLATQPSTSNGGDQSKLLTSPSPLLASNPSGLYHPSIGAARAKMANATASLVREQLVASLRCLPRRRKVRRYSFIESDLYSDNLLRAHLNAELARLADMKEAIPGLNKFVLRSWMTPEILGQESPVLNKLQSVFATPEPPRPAARRRYEKDDSPPPPAEAQKQPKVEKLVFESTKIEVKPSKLFPLLTLHSSLVPEVVRKRLTKAGIFSGLDLVGISADRVARQTGLRVDEIRALRLRLLGFPARTSTSGRNKSESMD